LHHVAFIHELGERNLKAADKKDTACSVALTTMREFLFPKNKLVEVEAWIMRCILLSCKRLL
jgi:hypothetical protein